MEWEIGLPQLPFSFRGKMGRMGGLISGQQIDDTYPDWQHHSQDPSGKIHPNCISYPIQPDEEAYEETDVRVFFGLCFIWRVAMGILRQQPVGARCIGQPATDQ
jgi:hypothetical protein